MRPSPAPPSAGFSLIEVVVVMLVLATLAGVVLPRVSGYQAKARDARRMQDLRVVQDAIEQYQLDKGVYPAAKKNGSYGGWDVSHDGDFIPTLVDEGYLAGPVDDPISSGTYHFRYYVYNKGSYGCAGTGPFYVLGVRNFESAASAAANEGAFQCTSRDWGNEFAYVTGGGASYK